MEELIGKLTDRFDLSEEQAQEVIETVSNFLEEKLPEPFGSQVSEFLSSGEMPGQLQDTLGGLFGG